MPCSGSLYDALYQSRTIQKKDLLPIKPEEETKPKDWVKITAIAILAIAGLVAAFCVLSISGMFPIDILGGTHNALFAAFGAGIVAAAAGGVVYYKWKTAD
ncbi:MAG: hypothetical protein JJU12_08450 [Chlamydiales bacterium]|nr:hypothetical protein [Chlamydiales bacterium]